MGEEQTKNSPFSLCWSKALLLNNNVHTNHTDILQILTVLAWSWRVCISHKLPGDAEGAHPSTIPRMHIHFLFLSLQHTFFSLNTDQKSYDIPISLMA